MFWEFFSATQGEDCEFDCLQVLEEHINRNYRIKLAMIGDRVVGLLVDLHLFDDVYHVQIFYIIPELRDRKIGLSLMRGCYRKKAKLIYQTNNLIIPDQMMEYMKETSRLLFSEGKRSTWFSTWEER